MDFQHGDMVRLKSGGPTMTLDDIGEHGIAAAPGTRRALCSWFAAGKRMTDTFELHSLEKVVPVRPGSLRVINR